MISANDRAYQAHTNQVRVRAWMVNLYCALAWTLLTIALFQIPLVLLITTQCIKVDAISVGGKRFQTDSQTCPSQEVARVWTKKI